MFSNNKCIFYDTKQTVKIPQITKTLATNGLYLFILVTFFIYKILYGILLDVYKQTR